MSTFLARVLGHSVNRSQDSRRESLGSAYTCLQNSTDCTPYYSLVVIATIAVFLLIFSCALDALTALKAGGASDYVPLFVSFSRTTGCILVGAELAFVLEAYTVGHQLVPEKGGAISQGLAVRFAIVNTVCVGVILIADFGYRFLSLYMWEF